jgi:glycosyltransferase involved in cell wall biosynthesis
LGYNPLVARICILPKAINTGGVTSFQAKLVAGLAERGIQTCFNLAEKPYDAVLLTGGARDLTGLWRARRNGVRIVQRLDGINWLHRRLQTGTRHFLRAEYGNRLLALLRARFSSQIVYQSEFVHGWWRERFGPELVPSFIIHNGVDLSEFTPNGSHERPTERYRLLLVEGSLQGGYETGLETALGLAEHLGERFSIELMVAGRVSIDLQAIFEKKSRVPIRWVGLVPHEQIPALDRSLNWSPVTPGGWSHMAATHGNWKDRTSLHWRWPRRRSFKISSDSAWLPVNVQKQPLGWIKWWIATSKC